MPTSPRHRCTRTSRTSRCAACTRPRTRARDSAHASRSAQRRPWTTGAALLFLLALLIAAACGGGLSSPQATAAPTPAPPLRTDQPARRDLADLAERLRGAVAPARSVQLPPLNVGDVQQFDLVDLPSDPNEPPGHHTISATVRGVSEHAYFVFEDGVEVIDEEETQAAVRAFEDTVWPEVTGIFGLPATPGVDGDPRIVVLHAGLGDSVGGYVNGDDAYPRTLVARSNQREMVYLNTSVRPLGSDGYLHILAHELQHLIHRAHGGDSETWINEGLSEYAGDLVSGLTTYESYLNRPDTQLTTWDEENSGAHYGASGLFIDYLMEQTGGDAGRLASAPGYGTEGVRTFLRETGSRRTFEQMVADWAIANLLDQPEGPLSGRGVLVVGAGRQHG